MKRYQKPLFLLAFFLILLFPPLRGAALCALSALLLGRLAAEPLQKLEALGCPRWLGGVFLLLGCCLLLFPALYALLSRLCGLVNSLTAAFPDLSSLFERLEDAARPLGGSIGAVVRRLIDLLSHRSEALPDLFAANMAKLSRRAVSALPRKLLFLFMTLLAAYYAAVDWNQLRPLLRRTIPEDWQRQTSSLLRLLGKGALGWLRVQSRLAMTQFLLLTVGFLILRVRSPLFSAFFAALADALPLLGTGAVLGPWSALLWLMGETRRAAGMLVLWACSWTVRAVIEPRLVGHQAGISPFFTVVGMYLGLRCFGAVGMIAGAVVMSAIGAFRSSS